MARFTGRHSFPHAGVVSLPAWPAIMARLGINEYLDQADMNASKHRINPSNIPCSTHAEMNSMAGKVALVTGAARGKDHFQSNLLCSCDLHTSVRWLAGIGYACAQALGRAGASVMLVDVDGAAVSESAQQLEREEGVAAAAVACDVSKREEVQLYDGVDLRMCHVDMEMCVVFL
jgi:hypothetical protein